MKSPSTTAAPEKAGAAVGGSGRGDGKGALCAGSGCMRRKAFGDKNVIDGARPPLRDGGHPRRCVAVADTGDPEALVGCRDRMTRLSITLCADRGNHRCNGQFRSVLGRLLDCRTTDVGPRWPDGCPGEPATGTPRCPAVRHAAPPGSIRCHGLHKAARITLSLAPGLLTRQPWRQPHIWRSGPKPCLQAAQFFCAAIL